MGPPERGMMMMRKADQGTRNDVGQTHQDVVTHPRGSRRALPMVAPMMKTMETGTKPSTMLMRTSVHEPAQDVAAESVRALKNVARIGELAAEELRQIGSMRPLRHAVRWGRTARSRPRGSRPSRQYRSHQTGDSARFPKEPPHASTRANVAYASPRKLIRAPWPRVVTRWPSGDLDPRVEYAVDDSTVMFAIMMTNAYSIVVGHVIG